MLHNIRPLVLIACFLFLSGCSFGTRYIFKTNDQFMGTPEDIGIPFEDVHFSSQDGTMLHGWHIPSSRNLPLILYFHGNAANITFRVENIAYFHELGFPIFIFDYRGFGASEGRALYEEDLQDDAKGAINWLKEKGWAPEQMIFYGRSLGAAVAIKLALELPPLGIVLEAPFTSLHAIAPLVDPASYYLFGFWSIGRSFDNLDKISKLPSPLLIFHGDQDTIIPPEMSRELFAKAPQPKKLVEIQGANHSNSFSAGGEVYRQAWLDFVETAKNNRTTAVENQNDLSN